MSQARSYEGDIRAAADEVISVCSHALPHISDLVTKLSDVDQHRDQLLKMVHASSKYMQNIITSQQYQLLLEFTAMQAAKANIEHEELLDEICLRYTLMDVQELKIRDFWEAVNFSWHYAEDQI